MDIMDKKGFTPLERKFYLLGGHRKTFNLLRDGIKKYIARPVRKNLSNGLRWGFRHRRLPAGQAGIRLGRKSSHLSFLTGYTLIELLITMAIIGILAAVAVTAYIGTTKKAARSEAYSNLESLRLLEEQFFADIGDYTAGLIGIAGSTFVIRDANLVLIQAPGVLPGFRPGNAAIFSYRIIQNVALDPANITVPYNGVSVVQTPCFIAIAEGIDDTRVENDIFAIDCNNNRTF